MQEKFYELLYESVNNKQENNIYLISAKYISLINVEKETKCVKEKQTIPSKWLKCYGILNIGDKGKLAAPLSAEKKRKPCTM